MTKRLVALLLASFALVWGMPANAREKGITMMGAALFESCPMMLMANDRVFEPLGRETGFAPWRTPDQYRAMLTTGRVQFVTVSTLEYSRLQKKLKKVRLLFTVEGSPLYLLGHSPANRVENLRGKSIALPFRGDMPELMLAMLVRNSSISLNEIRIVSGGGAIAASQLVITGRADYVAVPEPLAALVVEMSKIHDRARKTGYAMSMQEAWGRQYPNGPGMLLSHIIAVDVDEKIIRIFQDNYLRYVEICRSRPQQGADLFIRHFPAFKAEKVETFLADSNARIHNAPKKQEELKEFIRIMEQVSDEIF